MGGLYLFWSSDSNDTPVHHIIYLTHLMCQPNSRVQFGARDRNSFWSQNSKNLKNIVQLKYYLLLYCLLPFILYRLLYAKYSAGLIRWLGMGFHSQTWSNDSKYRFIKFIGHFFQLSDFLSQQLLSNFLIFCFI